MIIDCTTRHAGRPAGVKNGQGILFRNTGFGFRLGLPLYHLSIRLDVPFLITKYQKYLCLGDLFADPINDFDKFRSDEQDHWFCIVDEVN